MEVDTAHDSRITILYYYAWTNKTGLSGYPGGEGIGQKIENRLLATILMVSGWILGLIDDHQKVMRMMNMTMNHETTSTNHMVVTRYGRGDCPRTMISLNRTLETDLHDSGSWGNHGGRSKDALEWETGIFIRNERGIPE